jgi:PHD/YefM family antitoxin component YafN of YafNO toxin-antitoxin module
MKKPTRFITNENNEKEAVVIPIEEYRQLLEELEELDEIRAFDQAEASGETPISFERTASETNRTPK